MKKENNNTVETTKMLVVDVWEKSDDGGNLWSDDSTRLAAGTILTYVNESDKDVLFTTRDGRIVSIRHDEMKHVKRIATPKRS